MQVEVGDTVEVKLLYRGWNGPATVLGVVCPGNFRLRTVTGEIGIFHRDEFETKSELSERKPMRKFKITYCKRPTNQNSDKCIIVKCEDRAEALVTAFDHLTNKGYVVGKCASMRLTPEEQKKITDRKVRFTIGAAYIFTSAEPYEVVARGTVEAST